MDYSRSIKSAVKKAKITIQDKIFADLMLSGWKDQDAFIAAFGYNINYSEEYVKTQMRNMLSNPELAKYMSVQGMKNEMKSKDTEDMSDEEVLSKATKEETLKDLLRAKSKMRFGSKEWLDATKLIADLQQMKKDVVEEEDTTVHYYLPLNCRNCELYIKSQSGK